MVSVHAQHAPGMVMKRERSQAIWRLKWVRQVRERSRGRRGREGRGREEREEKGDSERRKERNGEREKER